MNDTFEIPRLSAKERAILDFLLDKGEAYGLEMVAASQGALKRGTIYVTLNRMEDKGYVESWREELPPDDRRLPRRMYRVSGLGARVRHAWQLAGAAMAEEAG